MALQDAPDSIDSRDIQFKGRSRFQLFNVNASTPDHSGIDLLVSASTFGLIIIGRPSTSEIQVLRLKDVIENGSSSTVAVRSFNLPGKVCVLALSSDHTLLSACYTANGITFMDIYAVQSLLSNNVTCVLSKVALSNTDGVRVKQVLWNPVIAETVAVCLSDGTFGIYIIKSNSFEFNALNKALGARCACWSPKGKQIVVAFPMGKLAQYKPDLKLAKEIPCSVPLFNVPFSPIAVQWLSTYQFAVVYAEEKEDATQSLFIVNTSKTAPPSYINYYDITYGQSGPRAPQVFLIHILKWNLLLMASSNGTEIGILGTTETGETPLWKQYILIDERRAELPLTDDKQDTFPIGLALETGSTHQLTIDENQLPVMPMLHILSTHGLILSFDFLNFQPVEGICSPPQNIADQSGAHLFKVNANDNAASQPDNKLPSSDQHLNNLTFAIPETAATSTPAKPAQTKSIFGSVGANNQQQKPNLFGALTQGFGAAPPPAFGSTNPPAFGGTSAPAFGASPFASGTKDTVKPFSAPPVNDPAVQAQATAVQKPISSVPKVQTEGSKPLLTVPTNYKPSPQPAKSASASIISSSESDAILRKLIKEQTEAFGAEIRESLNRSRNIQIQVSAKEEVSKLIKNIDEMQKISAQATESTESIKADVQSLHLTLFELLAMQAEAQSKVDEFKKVGKPTDDGITVNQTYRRMVDKLQSQLAQNQARFDVFNKQLDANWSSHLQNKRINDRDRMKIPSLENVYQTMEKQQHVLLRGKEKINKLKSKIGVRDSSPTKIKYSYSKTDNIKLNSLVDSVLSLTISDQVKNERKSLNTNKMDSLRKATLGHRQVNIVKPTRPDRQGLNSEIIIEKRLAYAKAQTEKEKLKKSDAEAERVKQQEIVKQQLAMQQQDLFRKQKDLEKKEELIKQKLLAVAQAQQQQKPREPEKPIAATKSMFSGDSTTSPFGSTITMSKPEPTPIALSGKSTVSASPISSGFSSGARAETSNVSSFGPASSGFSFASEKPTLGLTGQTKSDGMNLTKLVQATTTTAPNETKSIGFGVTSATSSKDPIPATAAINLAANAAAVPLTKTTSSVSITPIQNVPPKPALSTVAPIASSASSSAFKFDIGNIIGDKSKNDKENSLSQSVPNAKPSSTGSFSFSLSGTDAPATQAPLAKPANQAAVVTSSAPLPVSTPVVTPKQTDFSFAKASAESSIFGGKSAPTNIATPTGTVVSSAPSSGSLFQGMSICKPTVADSSNSGKLFSTNSFGDVSSSTSTASIFGATSSPASTDSNMFGAASVPTTTSAPTNLFGGQTTDASANQPATGTNIFGAKISESTTPSFAGFGISSTPPSSVANSPSGGNIFATAAATTPQNLFGGGNTANNNANAASIFGGASAASPSNNFNTPLFGNATASPNVFGGSGAPTPTNNVASPQSPSSNSLFGGNSNAMSGGSFFGGSASFSSPQQPTTGSIFGSSGFGGGFQQQPSTASTPSTGFGNSLSQAATNPPAFGSPFAQSNTPAPAFGSPQSNAPAPNAFGSPQQSSFGLGAIAASANPTFGSSATFGATATFGSPKSGFGSFTNVNPNPAFQSPQNNNLFESLGSSENAMTFGNLAQAQNPTAPKQFSSGSSFSSWR